MSEKEEHYDSQTLPVYVSKAFFCASGVADGDGISFADDLVMDDIYQLAKWSEKTQLSLTTGIDEKSYLISSGSTAGTAGNQVFLDSCLMFIAPDSTTFEVIVFVEVEDGSVEEIYILPFAPLVPGTDYRLVGIDRRTGTARLAEVACMSFARGTHITMSSGAQVLVEDLKEGDNVLTRDDGVKPIRWVGKTTFRAVGDFAPVVIRKGTLNNDNDLRISPEHRIFVYQREDQLGVGRSEVLVKARHLINGDSVYQEDGGFVDYFQVLFDEHQIIYAEGIATETLLVDPRTRGAVPEEINRRVSGNRPGHERPTHLDYEVQETLASIPDAAELLKRASRS